MRQASSTEHTLEIRLRPDLGWGMAAERMYQPARLLVHQGQLIAAIDTAGDILVKARGNMHGVAFRVVTTTKTVTVLGSFDDAVF